MHINTLKTLQPIPEVDAKLYGEKNRIPETEESWEKN
jgi:hypothetical protein